MKADLWLVNADTSARVEQVHRLLPGQRVAIVNPVDLASLHGPATRPAALIVVTNSWRRGNQRHLAEITAYAKLLPMLVVDASFDPRIAGGLAAHDVQDYVSATDLTAERLAASIDFAVIRHGHQSVRNMRPLIEARPDLDVVSLRETICNLPSRERAVFDLLVACLPTAELAARLGRNPQTVRNQIASLKQRFGVNSREELVVIGILCLPETK